MPTNLAVFPNSDKDARRVVHIDVANIEYDRLDMVRMEEIVVSSWVRDGDAITARVMFFDYHQLQ